MAAHVVSQRNTGPVAGHNRVGARELISMPRRQGRARARMDTVCDGCSAAHRISISTMDARLRPGNASALGGGRVSECKDRRSRATATSCLPHPQDTSTVQRFSARGPGPWIAANSIVQRYIGNHNNITTAAHPLADR